MTGDNSMTRIFDNNCTYTAFIVIFMVLSLLSCSSSDKESKQVDETKVTANISLATAEITKLFFQKRAKEILIENKSKLKNPALIQQLETIENISARKKNLRECYKSIQESLGGEQEEDSIIYGKLENLGFLRDAWEVEVGQLEISMGACIEVNTGKIKVLWVNQEEVAKEESTPKVNTAVEPVKAEEKSDASSDSVEDSDENDESPIISDDEKSESESEN